MFKSILSFSVLAAVATFVNAEAAGPGGASLEARQPYTNGEAFRRGLPPLRPRHRGSRTWTAVKRQSSPVFGTTLLQFDDPAFSSGAGTVPQPYQGLNLDCTSCGYVQTASFPSWTSHSSPNGFYFYSSSYPTVTSDAGGLVRLRSMYCTQASGTTAQLTVTGSTGGTTVFTQDITCTPNGDTGATAAPTFNSFDLPAVATLSFSATATSGSWSVDDISISTIA